MVGTRNLWIGFVVGGALLAMFFLTVDLGRMASALASANYLYVVPGIGLYLVSVLFRTLRWQMLLRHMRPIKTTRLYPVVVVGYMANNLLPMRLGELVRSYYVGEREGISKTAALATIFIERVLDAMTLLLFISAFAFFVPLSGLAEAFGDRLGIAWPLLVSALSIPFVVMFLALLLLAFFPTKGQQMFLALVQPLPGQVRVRLRSLSSQILDGLVPLRSPRTLSLLFMLSVPIWMFEAGLFYLVGFSFGMNNVFSSIVEMAVASIVVTAVANILSSLPAAPGGIGLFELAARETLVFMSIAPIDRSVAGGFAAVVHMALLLPMIFLGQVFLWAEHISLRSLSRAGTKGEGGQTVQVSSDDKTNTTPLSGLDSCKSSGRECQ